MRWDGAYERYEGPNNTDYRPGNTYDRLTADPSPPKKLLRGGVRRAPFTEAEWEERKQYRPGASFWFAESALRSWDLVKFGYAMLALFLGLVPRRWVPYPAKV